MNNKKETGRISVRLPLELKSRLERVAEKHERSYGWVVQKCLKKLIKEMERAGPESFDKPDHELGRALAA